MLLDQTEKISKFVRIMERELNRRKKLLADYGVGILDLYRQASDQEEPAIVILLDSYEAFKEEAYEAELFKLLVRISREGACTSPNSSCTSRSSVSDRLFFCVPVRAAVFLQWRCLWPEGQ